MSLATISAFNLGFSWPTNFGTSGVLKIISTKTFVSGGLTYPSGRTSDPVNQNFCVQANISVAGSVATVASFQLPQTDATDVTIINGSGVPLYVGIIYSNAGTTKQRILFENWHLSSSLTTSFSFAAWTVDNAASGIVNPPIVYLNSDEVQNAITARLNSTASTSALGIVKISTTPADTSSPIAVGKNDYASTSNLGVGKISVAPTSASSPIFVGDNDPRLLSSTGTLTSTGAILIGADTDASGSDGITLQTRGVTRLTIANDATTTFAIASLYSSSSAGQSFSQVDQITGTPTSAKAGTLIETALNASSLGTFNVVGRIYAGTNNNYIVGVAGEARSTVNVASAAELVGTNGVVDSEVGHTGQVRAIEGDINYGTGDASANYTTHLTDTHFGTGLFITSGGRKKPNVGIYLYGSQSATTGANKFRYGANINSDAYDTTGLFLGDAAGPSNSIVGELVVRHINTRDAIAVQASGAGTGGTAFNVYSSAASSVASILPTGEYTSTVGFKTTGTASKFYVVNGEGFELWKDATPSTAWDMGNRVPGGAVTDDIIFSYFGGASWAEAARLTGASVLKIASGGSIQIAGTQVLGARQTGWTTNPTGTLTRTTFDSTTVALPDLAARVAALIVDLRAQGEIGA